MAIGHRTVSVSSIMVRAIMPPQRLITREFSMQCYFNMLVMCVGHLPRLRMVLRNCYVLQQIKLFIGLVPTMLFNDNIA